MTRIDLSARATVRERVLFLTVIAVLVVLFSKVLYKGQSRQVELFERRIAALKIEREALIHFSAQPIAARGQFFLEQKGIKFKILAGQVLPSYEGVSTFLEEATSGGFLGNLRVENLSYLPTLQDRGVGWSQTDFTLNLRGGFTDLIQYLTRLEEFPALATLQNVSLKVAEGQPQDVQAEIAGRFFQVKTPGAVRHD